MRPRPPRLLAPTPLSYFRPLYTHARLFKRECKNTPHNIPLHASQFLVFPRLLCFSFHFPETGRWRRGGRADELDANLVYPRPARSLRKRRPAAMRCPLPLPFPHLTLMHLTSETGTEIKLGDDSRIVRGSGGKSFLLTPSGRQIDATLRAGRFPLPRPSPQDDTVRTCRPLRVAPDSLAARVECVSPEGVDDAQKVITRARGRKDGRRGSEFLLCIIGWVPCCVSRPRVASDGFRRRTPE